MLFFIFLITTGSHWKNIQYGNKNLLAKFYTQLTCTSCRLAVVKSHAAFLTLTDSHPRISALLPSPYFTSSLSLFASIKLSTRLSQAWRRMVDAFCFSFHSSRLFVSLRLFVEYMYKFCNSYYYYLWCTCCICVFQNLCNLTIFSLFLSLVFISIYSIRFSWWNLAVENILVVCA